MGRNYIQCTKEEPYGRTLAPFSMGRADLFFQVAKLLENKLNQPCGITDYFDMDEYAVDAEKFILFFEKFMAQEWEGEGVEYLYNWAAFAAGMIVNITLEYRLWQTPKGKVLLAQRYIDFDAKLDAKWKSYMAEVIKLPQVEQALDVQFNYLPLREYARIIRSLTDLN